MRLLRLDIRGFGRLEGTFPLDVGEGKAALLLERNEAGKSTLCAAILAGLYGVDNDRRRSPRDKLVEADVYRPWEGGPFGLTLHVRAGGKEFAIERDFERNTVRVLAGGRDHTDLFRQGSHVRVGEILLGLTKEQFTRSIFVGQGDIIWNDAAGLTEALQRMASSEGGRTTAAGAIAALDQAMIQYDGLTMKGRGRVETEIERCRTALAELGGQRDELAVRRKQMASKIELLAEREQEDRNRDDRRQMLRRRWAELDLMELEEQLRVDDERRARLAEIEAEDAEAAPLLQLQVESVERVNELRRRLEAVHRAQVEDEEEALAVEERLSEARVRRDALGLRRIPTESDRSRLQACLTRTQVAREEHQRMTLKLGEETLALRQLGTDLESARNILHALDDLSEDERVLLTGAVRAQVQEGDRRQLHEEEEARAKSIRTDIRAGQHLRKHFGIWLMIMGMLPVLVGLAFFPSLPFHPGILLGPGGAAIGAGIVAYFVGTRHRKREDRDAKAAMQRHREALGALGDEAGARERAWEHLAENLGVEPDELEPLYELAMAARRGVEGVEMIEARLQEAEAAQARILEELAPSWDLFGEEASLDELEERLTQVSEGVAAFRAVEAGERATHEALERAVERSTKAATLEQELRMSIAACGVVLDTRTSLEDGYVLVNERWTAAQRAQHRHQILLPELRASVIPEEERSGRLERVDELKERIARGGIPDLSTYGMFSKDQVNQALGQLDREETEARERDSAERAEARAFLAEYESRVPALLRGLDEHERALRRALEFQAAVKKARTVLEEIALETYRDWARALNRNTNSMLEALGSDARDLKFDETLGIQLRYGHKTLTGSEAVQQLSAGAVDRVYLAARLAVSRLLSDKDEPLPLVLDDPFANADDERLLDGLRLLVEALAPQQQVLLLACQKTRYSWAMEQLGLDQRLMILPHGDVALDPRAG